jgi:crotonobetainyl-CoA:carnitine CoA-transferase CaiB-like acyl-CoA transferase
LEVGEDFACAYAGHLLALLGAEVVRVTGPARRAEEAQSWGLDLGKILFKGEVSSKTLAWLPVVAAVDSTRSLHDANFPVIHAAPSPTPARSWASSGAMGLTGRADGPPLLAPGDVATCLDGAALALRLLTAARGGPGPDDGAAGPLDGSAGPLVGSALLGERAAHFGHHRNGSVSNGGSCHLVAGEDGWLAVNLSRDSDLELLPAWLEGPIGNDPWASVVSFAQRQSVYAFADRAQLLGIPVAVVGGHEGANGQVDEQYAARGQQWPSAPWLHDGTAPCLPPARICSDLGLLGPSRAPSRARPLVVDLSALWAGPLAASLLIAAGCRVVKVEDPRRPDPGRQGPRSFFDLLQGGKESVTMPVAATGLFPALVASADVVIEASRPRALEHLGIYAQPHQAWISITGYGRVGPWRNRVALGDDAAAGAGWVTREDEGGPPLFCADAAADPITGLHAAVAALAAVVGGNGGTIDIAMREVVGHVLSYSRPAPSGDSGPVAPPRSRTPTQPAAEMGADTDAVLAELSDLVDLAELAELVELSKVAELSDVAHPPNVADPSDRANR